MPHLYIITGSNGAGKSTVGASYFPEYSGEIFDDDKLYLQKKSSLWKAGLRVQKELNKQASEFVEQTFNRLIETAIQSNVDFAYEGHFSKDESWTVPQRFKAKITYGWSPKRKATSSPPHLPSWNRNYPKTSLSVSRNHTSSTLISWCPLQQIRLS